MEKLEKLYNIYQYVCLLSTSYQGSLKMDETEKNTFRARNISRSFGNCNMMGIAGVLVT